MAMMVKSSTFITYCIIAIMETIILSTNAFDLLLSKEAKKKEREDTKLKVLLERGKEKRLFG